MTFNDALTVTWLGIGIVFGGLILTSLLIISFSIPERLKKRKEAKAVEATPAPVAVPAEKKPVGITAPVKVEPEVLAVITTILEIELRLQLSSVESRFTFSENR